MQLGEEVIKKVLVPVDGSEHSAKALGLAAVIAEKFDAALSALFVASLDIDEELQHFTNHEYSFSAHNSVMAASEQIGKSILKGMINKLEPGVKVKTVVLFGNPASRIIEYARDNSFDMIVMGNRGLSDIKGLLMGSVSRKVNRQVKCTFITVK